jgi:excisionase family DNA binding protein
MPPSEPTRAVYVRMPDKVAQKLDKAAERFGVSKRDLLATLVSDHLDIEGDELVFRPGGRPDGTPKPPRPGDLWRKFADSGAAGTDTAGPQEGTADNAAPGPRVRMTKPAPAPAPAPAAPVSEVLTLAEAAELLRVPADDVRALVESGELPARRIGETWRFTRTAVLGWLAGPGPTASD